MSVKQIPPSFSCSFSYSFALLQASMADCAVYIVLLNPVNSFAVHQFRENKNQFYRPVFPCVPVTAVFAHSDISGA